MANSEKRVKFAQRDVGFAMQSAVWRSADSGVSWSKVLDDGRYTALVALPEGFVVVAGAGGQLAISYDSGETWKATSVPDNGGIKAMSVSDPSNLAIATYSQKLFFSGDQGTTWNEIPRVVSMASFGSCRGPRNKRSESRHITGGSRVAVWRLSPTRIKLTGLPPRNVFSSARSSSPRISVATGSLWRCHLVNSAP
jgi:photosystem II stability/assembly factor-like uncharacterized protein